MDLYRDIILDHYKHPRNFGHLPHPTHVAEDDNVSCGDRIGMELILHNDEKGIETVQDVRFYGEGCAINQASASMLTEQIIGKEVGWIKSLTADFVFDYLGTPLTPARVKCAVLPLEVLQIALTSKI